MDKPRDTPLLWYIEQDLLKQTEIEKGDTLTLGEEKEAKRKAMDILIENWSEDLWKQYAQNTYETK